LNFLIFVPNRLVLDFQDFTAEAQRNTNKEGEGRSAEHHRPTSDNRMVYVKERTDRADKGAPQLRRGNY